MQKRRSKTADKLLSGQNLKKELITFALKLPAANPPAILIGGTFGWEGTRCFGSTSEHIEDDVT